jgi:hypothetical protein
MGLEIVPVKNRQLDQENYIYFAYHTFHVFRMRVAAHLGIDLEAMDGFDGTQEWTSVDDEPLVHLLRHSDCDGELDRTECAAIATRLRAVTEATFPKARDVDTEHGEENEWLREKGVALAAACEDVANDEYERLVFL